MTNSLHMDSFKICTNANPDGWGNKLVTIFAPYLDNFFMTINFSLICQIRAFRLWTNPSTVTTLSFAGTGKNCAMVACPPGLIRSKVPGHVTADSATNVYYRNRRAVSIYAGAKASGQFTYSKTVFASMTDRTNANEKDWIQ
ncbi:MAG: hypothetical protein IPJ16_02180 [Bacteroidales bacterium]|nr:hypothetical protein [Bacteroidales bacterium]